MRTIEIIVALTVGALALLVLDMMGLIIKFTIIIALLMAVGAWVAIRLVRWQS